jgi:hypothetical protein
MKYLVQSILIDGNIETVIESIKTDDVRAMVEWLMKRHKNSHNYRYVVMDIATQEILINTTRNIFGW